MGITLDDQIFVERGEIISHEGSLPLVSTTFRANLFWLGRRPLDMDKPYLVRLATHEVECRVAEIHRDRGRRQPLAGSATDPRGRETQRGGGRHHPGQGPGRLRSVRRLRDHRAALSWSTTTTCPEGGIITEMVADREETLRIEARQRDFAWVKGDVTLADRAKNYGHRAALVLLIGPDTTGKTFLAKKVESMLVAEGRHVYMLDPENLRRGLDADLEEGDARETIRRYGEVARLLIDTGVLLISTTNSFNLPADQTVEAIRTLVHPAPVLTVYMSRETEPAPIEADLTFTGPEDFTRTTHDVLAALKQKGILAETIGNQPVFQFSI